MFDYVTSFLFEDSFPRELGRKRELIKNKMEFESKIDLLNGVDEVFSNVNPLNGEINKIFIDFDGKESLAEAKTVYTYCLSQKIPCIPIASGKKGVHLYILLKTRRGEDNKEILYKTTKSILLKSLPISKSVDSHVIGDVRRLCRVPNTLRPPENGTYCTYLPPQKGFLEMSETDLLWYMKGTHVYQFEDYIDPKTVFPTFDELISPEVDKEQVKFTYMDDEQSPKFSDNELLRRLLRPCLYRLMTVEEPRHKVRVAATADLLRADLSRNEIVELYRTLNWRDWDENWTRYQIEHTKKFCFSKRKLKELGICFDCDRSCF